jgi:hypothetical protein
MLELAKTSKIFCAGGIEDLEPLPALAVDKDLDAAVLGRGVDLEDDPGGAELLRRAAAGQGP